MSAEQERVDRLWDLRSRISIIRCSAAEVSPAADELLKAAERTLAEEAVIAHKVVMEQKPWEPKR